VQTILLFGAGKSATVLIDYLIAEAQVNNWHIIIADASKPLIIAKTKEAACTEAVELDINNTAARNQLIQRADIVISMMPPALHYLVAEDCIAFGKNLLTASYVDEKLKAHRAEIESKGLIFLCEMGLDPGIDHLSAMKLIDTIKQKGGVITSFKSHCGGLVAPESDDNPWKYKISWNPRNVVLAGKAGAVYKKDGQIINEKYEDLFDPERGCFINDLIGFLSYYPNRDSLPYIDLYGLQQAHTFVRTTLRYPDFMYGWKNIVDLHLTDETQMYETDGMPLSTFFKEHYDKNDLQKVVGNRLSERIAVSKKIMEDLEKLEKAQAAQEEAIAAGIADDDLTKEFSMVNEKGELQTLDIDEMKRKAASIVAIKMHEANLTLKQIFFLGADDSETIINKGLCSAADVLQLVLEKKLALQPQDKDMIVMKHEIEYELEGKTHVVESCLVVKGEDSVHTAMAKTVGLPLGIAAKLILNGTIKKPGLRIPVTNDIYEPVLTELVKNGIEFTEMETIRPA
jgi:saccharopine dehydrogenase-like NADP-dependent oxidoreductase